VKTEVRVKRLQTNGLRRGKQRGKRGRNAFPATLADKTSSIEEEKREF